MYVHQRTHSEHMGHTPAGQSVPADDGGWVDLELDKLLCVLQELGSHYHLQKWTQGQVGHKHSGTVLS